MRTVWTLITGAVLLSGCAGMKRAMLEEAMVDIWENGNTQRITDAYEPELGYEIRRFVEENRALYPDISISIDDAIIKGNRYVTLWTVHGTHRDLGREVTLSGVSVRTRVDGRIVDEAMFYDAKSIYDQLGFTVVPPAELSPWGKVVVDRGEEPETDDSEMEPPEDGGDSGMKRPEDGEDAGMERPDEDEGSGMERPDEADDPEGDEPE